MTETYELSLCGDCIYTDANGWDEAETGEPFPVPNPLSLIGDLLIGPVLVNPDGERGIEPDYAEPYFSWSPCQGCGSTLGGARYDYVGVKR